MFYSFKPLLTVAADFMESESGASAIEYGFLMAMLSLALIIALQATGASLSSLFTYVGNTITGFVPPPATPPHAG